LLGSIRLSASLRLWLLQGRLTVAPGVLVLGGLTLAAVLGYVALLLTKSPLVGITALCFGLSVPTFIVWRARRKRFNLFASQLPDALTMMKNSLQAGHTLDRAMLAVAEEMPDPIALEFRETIEELHLGVPIKRAIQNLTMRVVDDNLNIFAAALLVQREVGGNLGQLLGNLSETIRERFRINQEVRTLTAEGRMSGYVVGVLPIALAMVIKMIQPDYLDPLIDTEGGHTLLKIAAFLEVTGFYFISKACKVNY
jgi:tight adherence protein B